MSRCRFSFASLLALALAAGCGAAASTAGDGGPGTSCGSSSCAVNDVCVRTEASGGACMMPGDGGCPDGSTLSGACCAPSPTYACAASPAGCGATVTCTCAASTLCPPAYSCTAVGGTEIDCSLLAP